MRVRCLHLFIFVDVFFNPESIILPGTGRKQHTMKCCIETIKAIKPSCLRIESHPDSHLGKALAAVPSTS